jgi:hypothetical protein
MRALSWSWWTYCGAALLTPTVQAQPAASSVRIYIVERIGSELSSDARVGVSRAGLLCAPDRRLAWKDVGAGPVTQQKEIVQDALDRAGLRTAMVLPTGARRHDARRISGVIEQAHFALCDRHWALSRAHALSGEASIVLHWRLELPDGSAPPQRFRSSVTRTIAPAEAASIGTIYEMLLDAAAEDLARQLSAAASL